MTKLASDQLTDLKWCSSISRVSFKGQASFTVEDSNRTPLSDMTENPCPSPGRRALT